MGRFRYVVALAVCELALLLTPVGAGAVRYSIYDLGPAPSGGNAFGLGINATGDITGQAVKTVGSTIVNYPFRFTAAHGMEALSSLGGDTAYGLRINAAGHVAGYSTTTGNSTTHAVLWTGAGAGGSIDLDASYDSLAHGEAIDDSDTVYGWLVSAAGPEHAVRWNPYLDFGSLGDWGKFLGAYVDADVSFAVGQYAPGGGAPPTAFKYNLTTTHLTPLPVTFGTTDNAAYDINGSAVAVGYENVNGKYWAVVWPGTGQPVQLVGGTVFTAEADGINGSGSVVGVYVTGIGTSHGFIYDGSSTQDIAPPIVAPGSLAITAAHDINDAGEIAATLSNGHAALLTVCGNGTMEGAEECDLGAMNGTANACCDEYCRKTTGNTCRPATGVCDHAETCNNGTCAADAVEPTTTVCRPANGECDLAESCDGSSKACPTNAFKTSGMCTDEGNPCTQNVCDGSGPGCSYTHPAAAGLACSADDMNPCTVEQCDGVHLTCQHIPGNSGASCTDNNTNTCLFSQCDGVNAACQHPPKPNGVSCDDHDACTTGETCQAATCQGGSQINCSDGNSCTADSCSSASGCQHASLPNCDPARSSEARCTKAAGCTINSPNIDLTVPPNCLPQDATINIVGEDPATVGSCPQYFDLHGLQNNQLVSCTELYPANQVFNCPVTLNFKWANVGGTCNVSVPSGVIQEGRIRVLRNGTPVETTALQGCGTSGSSKQCPTEATLSYGCNYTPDPTFCTAGSSATCSPGANTWTVQAQHFSEYALGEVCSDAGPTRMTVGHVGALSAGRLSLRGELVPRGGSAPDVDPGTNGLEVIVHQKTDTALQVVLPGGALWTESKRGGKWTYKNKADAPGGIHKAVVNLASAKPSFTVNGRGATYAFGQYVSVELNFPGSDVCVVASFADVGCTVSGGGQTLKCR